MTQVGAFFSPRSVAVVGASDGVTATGAPKLGTAALQNLVQHGYRGDIYVVNPAQGQVGDFKSYPSLPDLPHIPELALIVLPPDAAISAVRDCAALGVHAAVICSSGFSEAGRPDLEQQLTQAADGRVRLVGPNTTGVVCAESSLFASISAVAGISPIRGGSIALITQSGAVGGSLLGRAQEEEIPVGRWVATGNEADLVTADFIVHMASDPAVEVIALFLEGVRMPDRFIAGCRAAREAGKPVVVYKAGASEAGAAAAASHTGAMVGADPVFDAVCRAEGIVRVHDLDDLLPVANALHSGTNHPRGKRVAVVSSSGGIGGVAADALSDAGLTVPELSDPTRDAIALHIPSFGSTRNPVDITGQSRSFANAFADVLAVVASCDDVDQILVPITTVVEPRATLMASQLVEAAKASSKPIVVAWVGPHSLAKGATSLLRQSGVPTAATVREAVTILKALQAYGSFRPQVQTAAAR